MQTVGSVTAELTEDYIQTLSEQSRDFDSKLNTENFTNQVTKIIILYSDFNNFSTTKLFMYFKHFFSFYAVPKYYLVNIIVIYYQYIYTKFSIFKKIYTNISLQLLNL